MAIIGLAGIGYDQWIRFAFRRLAVIGIFCVAILIIAGI
jgi:uncharacterized ion transporter superfamily protein YfcC